MKEGIQCSISEEDEEDMLWTRFSGHCTQDNGIYFLGRCWEMGLKWLCFFNEVTNQN